MKKIRRKLTGLILTVILLPSLVLLTHVDQALQVVSDQSLRGTIIVVDAGHGGRDPGATVQDIREETINLATAKKLKNLLEASGETDTDLAKDTVTHVKRTDLKRRAEIMNREEVTLFVSLHCNISLDNSVHGAEVYYQPDNPGSLQLAESILERMRKLTDSKFIPKTRDIYILNKTKTCGVLVELGFLSNRKERKKMQNEEYQEELAMTVYQGIKDFLQILQ